MSNIGNMMNVKEVTKLISEANLKRELGKDSVVGLLSKQALKKLDIEYSPIKGSPPDARDLPTGFETHDGQAFIRVEGKRNLEKLVESGAKFNGSNDFARTYEMKI